jgi:hypothetical protein
MLTYEDGSRYYGNWTDNQPQGVGILKENGQATYCGDFSESLLNGPGIETK